MIATAEADLEKGIFPGRWEYETEGQHTRRKQKCDHISSGKLGDKVRAQGCSPNTTAKKTGPPVCVYVTHQGTR